MDNLISLSHDCDIDVELTVDGAILKFRMFGVDTMSEFITLVVIVLPRPVKHGDDQMHDANSK
jgi:hypothetical protein